MVSPEQWLLANRFTKTSESSYVRQEKHRITITKAYDPESKADEWYSTAYDLEGRGSDPRESLADLMSALNARALSIQDMRKHIDSLLE